MFAYIFITKYFRQNKQISKDCNTLLKLYHQVFDLDSEIHTLPKSIKPSLNVIHTYINITLYLKCLLT